ncbi:hypothetical protein NESM_000221200 [Novymonas esmeraldas]|uniref:Uncharacterized protein n=1 Tax=Novymonas esmeraldas TaxID=1808958 RepID=A0AAW0F5N6_9TRYP
MLGCLDAVTGDALRSFHEALHQAQTSLQRDEERLYTTSQVLQTLVLEVEQLKAASAPSSPDSQRREALQAEKMKLSYQTRNQRDSIAANAEHIQRLKEPRVALTETVNDLRLNVKALRRQYAQRAAQVHSFLAQFLHPQNTLDSLRRQLAQLQEGRAASTAAVADARKRLHQQQTELDALLSVSVGKEAPHTESCEAQNDETATINISSGGGDTGATAAGISHHVRSCGDDTVDKAPLSAAEQYAEATRRRSAQVEAQSIAAAAQAADEARLQQARAELKETVWLLCHAIEDVDAAQQREQKTYRDALNSAVSGADGVGGAGVLQRCCRCNNDLFDGFC